MCINSGPFKSVNSTKLLDIPSENFKRQLRYLEIHCKVKNVDIQMPLVY